jgi:PQQ enzyme repeat
MRRIIVFAVICVSGCFSACGGSVQILQQPKAQTVIVGQTTTFSVTAQGSSTLSYQWSKGSVAINGATSSSYTTPTTTMSDDGSQFSVVVSSSGATTTSNAAGLTVAPATDVLTYHNDNGRTGQNLTESILTPANVNPTQFGKVGFYPADDLIDAQPLVASSVLIPNNGTHTLVIVGTENATLYAYDADSGDVIWKVSLTNTGETPSDDLAHGVPHVGANSTPVIDRAAGPNGAVYEVASSKDSSGSYHQRLHAVDLALGTELFGGPTEIQAVYPGTGDNSDGTNVIFDPGAYRERCALLLVNGVIYTTWASHFDRRPYTGWIIAYNASTLVQTSVLNIEPNGHRGAFWMSSAGPAADNSGNIFILAGNGWFDATLDANGFPSEGDYGNAFLKLSTSSGLTVSDYFEMYNGPAENAVDIDLGSGGPLVLPDLTDATGHVVHLAIGAGKDYNMYVVDRDAMGKFNSQQNNIYQELDGVLAKAIFSAPAYFNGTVYYGPISSPIQSFTITNAKLSTSPAAQTANSFKYPGATPSVSAHGTDDGIVWAIEGTSPSVLHAYDAKTLNELYNSDTAANNRDQFGDAAHFPTPTIANGKVFVHTTTGVAVFGLLPQQ